jgi:hypothetical protein
MFYRENGQFKTSYKADQQVFAIPQDRWAIVAIVVVRLRRGSAAGGRVHVPRHPGALPDPVAGGPGREYPGRLLRADHLGAGASMAVGAYAAYNFLIRVDGMPALAAILLGGLMAAAAGIVFGMPSLRVRGLVSRRGDAGVAVLLGLGLPAHQVVYQQFLVRVGVGRGHQSVRLDHQFADRQVPVLPRRPGRLQPHGEKPGARQHGPAVDGDTRHGRGGHRDRHPPDVRQAHRLRRQFLSTLASPGPCGASSTSAPGSRRHSPSTARCNCCSWSSSAAWARFPAASSAPPSS